MDYFFNREKFIEEIQKTKLWDIVIIGGGASGLGAALDASLRGYKTLCLERSDFAKGTSSRSTKLVHGGIRYLAQGNIKLVWEALRERGILLKNAAHLVKRQKFIIPFFNLPMGWFYWIGMKMYQFMAGRLSLGKSGYLSKKEILKELPDLKSSNIKGGVLYYDAQFDDARLAIDLAKKAAKEGATMLNYFSVVSFLKSSEKISGVIAKDEESQKEYSIFSKIVLNATGVFSDAILKMDDPSSKSFLKPSQGSHVVLGKKFFRSKYAMVIPKTSDGRVLFTLPWQDHVIVGTTDKGLDKVSMEPKPLREEIEFILKNFNEYFKTTAKRKDVLSTFSGLRPLVLPFKGKLTKDISRAHKIITSPSGLVTILGGKWTTYRKMAQDVVDQLILQAHLPYRPSLTHKTPISQLVEGSKGDHLDSYGQDKQEIQKIIKENPALGAKILEPWPYLQAEVVWALRDEMARNLEDILARRLRVLFIDAKAAIKMAPKVASLMAREFAKEETWEKTQVENFIKVASSYHF